MFNLRGRRVVVTGSADGVAGAIALNLAGRGCDVGFLNQNGNGSEHLSSQIVGLGRRTLCLGIDLTQGSEVNPALEEIVATLGGIDVLVNGAELFEDASILDTTEEQWDCMLDINLKSVFLSSKKVVPHLIQQKWGRIVNVSSLSGKDPTSSSGVNYAASMAGVLGFTRQLARQLAPYNITVNAVAPLTSRQPTAQSRKPDHSHELVKRVPLGRFPTVEDVARAVAFLVSDEAGFITGETIDLSGGLYKY
jgi:3-oxoacyl-[acyl-carrier protein] reductase